MYVDHENTKFQQVDPHLTDVLVKDESPLIWLCTNNSKTYKLYGPFYLSDVENDTSVIR